MKWKKDLIRGSQCSELSNEIKSINRTEWPKKSLQIHYGRVILMVLMTPGPGKTFSGLAIMFEVVH